MFAFHYPYHCGMKRDIPTVAWIELFCSGWDADGVAQEEILCLKLLQYDNLSGRLVGINLTIVRLHF